MFEWLKSDPTKTLKRQYARLMEEARDLQRGGDIRGFAAKSQEAQLVYSKVQVAENEQEARSA